MVPEGCDIRYHALAFCTAGIESTTISQAWFEVVPECATYIPPNRLPTPCSTAHNTTSTLLQKPRPCATTYTQVEQVVPMLVPARGRLGGRGGRGSRRHSVMQQCARWYHTRYHLQRLCTWYRARFHVLAYRGRGIKFTTMCAKRASGCEVATTRTGSGCTWYRSHSVPCARFDYVVSTAVLF